MVHTNPEFETSNLILDFEFDQHLGSHKHVINIIMWFRDMGCYKQQLHTQLQWWTVQLKTVSENTSKREKIQQNDKSQKCYFGQSHNQQNQKPTRSSEEEAEYQILN
jgi:hypothetical protein